MKISQIELFIGWLVVLGLNQALVRLTVFKRNALLFWSIQGLNAAAIVWLVGWGVPGLVGTAKLINWIIALVLGMHFAQNLQARMALQSNERREAIEREWEELQARREAIQRIEDEEKQKERAAPPAPPAEG